VRVPPHSEEAETSLLGALLLDTEAYIEVSPLVRSDDFYKEAHRRIFAAMASIAERKEAIDVVTVSEQLQGEGALNAVGGLSYLAGLSSQVPTAANATYYANIIKKKATLRHTIALCGQVAESCYGDVTDVESFIGDVEDQFLRITEGSEQVGVQDLKVALQDAFKHIEHLYDSDERMTGIRSGFVDLDKITAGWQRSDLIIIAARPAMGKTALCLNMATNAAVRFGHSVLFCSLEMSARQLATRMLASESRIDVSRVRTGDIREHEWTRLLKAMTELSKAKMFIDDTPALTPTTLASRAKRIKASSGLDMVIVDYLQLMETSKSNINSREQHISEISRSLKVLAKELDVPVIALAQLNRGVESRTDKRPMMSDLRESGAIEQDADIISFVYRDEYYNEDTEFKGIAEIIIGKHRSGATGRLQLRFFPEFTRFDNLANAPDTQDPPG
jgi:replicative DNA helicase